ncbi:MAG: hypothetical protein GTO18_13300 [Anaerolineales bacterium]|nr:hypothetical protein [Anaerolineales bacterium]
MSRLVNRVRTPVRREGGETYLLLTLFSFAASVTLTRLFLEVMGYPQLGGGGLHIAHVLWGGLILFIAALLPLIYANRWVYIVEAVLAGIGVGLFIDEVGKFITQTNDYFYPAAAPIVYAFFILTVLLYLRVRRPKSRSPRAELYRALDAFEEVLDRDLSPAEMSELEDRLQYVSDTAEQMEFAKLANELLEFIHSDAVQIAPESPTLLERVETKFLELEERWITPGRLKAIIIGGLLALGLMALFQLTRLLLESQTPETLGIWLAEWLRTGQVHDPSSVTWLLTRIGLEAMVGVMLILAAVLLLLGKDRWGTNFAFLSLLLSLTITNLIIFYFDQFSTIIPAVVQLMLFLGVVRYRRYLEL